MALHVSSSAFSEGQPIPEKYSCDGRNLSPPLKWSGAPERTKSIAIIADDPDAPSGTFTHWVLYDLPAKTSELKEGSSGTGKDGVNSFKKRAMAGLALRRTGRIDMSSMSMRSTSIRLGKRGFQNRM